MKEIPSLCSTTCHAPLFGGSDEKLSSDSSHSSYSGSEGILVNDREGPFVVSREGVSSCFGRAKPGWVPFEVGGRAGRTS